MPGPSSHRDAPPVLESSRETPASSEGAFDAFFGELDEPAPRPQQAPPDALVLQSIHRLVAQGALVIGVDEVGRGCLAGPVSAAAFFFKPGCLPPDGLKDSKKLSPKKREALVPLLEAVGCFGHGECTPGEIDQLGIVNANWLAMRRALGDLIYTHGLDATDLHLVVDGNQMPPFRHMALASLHCLPKADDQIASVSAASVLAKVRRDAQMATFAQAHPAYGFADHMGYGSPAHLAAIATLGPCELHRMTFAPLNKLRAKRSAHP